MILTSGKRAVIGEGALEKSAPFIVGMGKKALVVTGRIITKAGLAARVQNFLETRGIESVLFNDLPSEPDDTMIRAALEAFRKGDCDFIVGLGGGTPLDTAKAVAATSVLSGSLSDYAGREIAGDFPPLVLIPTTAGTGSEATKFFCYTDTRTQSKLLMRGDDLIPDLAVIDYTYSLSAPQSVTAATGMDALTHAVEAYTSRKANCITDLYCLDAVKRIFRFLPAAFQNGNDRRAREEMALASYEAGFCINNSSVTLVHGMSRPIGAVFHIPHGISNAMLIGECMDFALDGAYCRFARIARAIGKADGQDDDETAARKFLAALKELTCSLKIPTLAEYGLDREAFRAAEEKMAKDAIASGSPANTRKSVTERDAVEIYERLWW